MEVGFEQSMYTLQEKVGYLEICLVVSRNGSRTPFIINITTTKGTTGKLILVIYIQLLYAYNFTSAGSAGFNQSVQYLSFFNGSSSMSNKQCYNLSIINGTHCEYYKDCSKAYLLSRLTADDKFVKLKNKEVHVFIEEDLSKCGT